MSAKDTCDSVLDIWPVTITNGTSLTAGDNLGGLRLFGLVMPAQWTPANLTFQASFDSGASWHNLKDSTGNEITVTASANDCAVWVPTAFASVPMIRVRSGSAAAPVIQPVDSVIQLILRSI
jgi:hypothetical protein